MPHRLDLVLLFLLTEPFPLRLSIGLPLGRGLLGAATEELFANANILRAAFKLLLLLEQLVFVLVLVSMVVPEGCHL